MMLYCSDLQNFDCSSLYKNEVQEKFEITDADGSESSKNGLSLLFG
jgi:hypothetical protein